MIGALTSALAAMLDAAAAPAAVRDAEVSFDRPAENYNPQKTTINLFLYDIRENEALRSAEPVVRSQGGVTSVSRPPVRLACSYMITAWIESASTGEDALLEQHDLLGDVVTLFAANPFLPPQQGVLAAQRYPVPLRISHGDLVPNPAEFWSALGGKLRPALMLTATLAMENIAAAIESREVSTKQIVVSGAGLSPQTLFQFGGTVRRADTQAPLPDVALTLPALGLRTTSDAAGRYQFSVAAAGNLELRAAKQGFADLTATAVVPGTSPLAFDVSLTTAP